MSHTTMNSEQITYIQSICNSLIPPEKPCRTGMALQSIAVGAKVDIKLNTIIDRTLLNDAISELLLNYEVQFEHSTDIQVGDLVGKERHIQYHFHESIENYQTAIELLISWGWSHPKPPAESPGYIKKAA